MWLVGMMGCGKSTVGPALAARLGCPFVDSDAHIERASGSTVAGIFANEGEAAFRRRERATIEELAGEPAVVALGGGAVAQPGVIERLTGSGCMVYLRAAPESLLARVGDGRGRPLLEGTDGPGRLERLRALLAERRAGYEQAAVVVDTDDRSVEAVAGEVAERLRELREAS